MSGPTLRGRTCPVKAQLRRGPAWLCFVLLVIGGPGGSVRPTASQTESVPGRDLEELRRRFTGGLDANRQHQALEQLLSADPAFLAAAAVDPRWQPLVRARLERGLQTGDSLIVPLLIHLFTTATGEDRLDYEALLIRAGPVAVPALLPLLADSTEAGLALRAAEALGRIKAPEALPVLVRMLRRHADPWARAGAAHALGELGDSVATPWLIEALDDGNRDVGNAAVVALALLRAPEAVPHAVRRTAASHPATRKHAAHALGEIGPCLDPAAAARARARLRQMAEEDEDPGVRFMAARALRRWAAAETGRRLAQ